MVGAMRIGGRNRLVIVLDEDDQEHPDAGDLVCLNGLVCTVNRRIDRWPRTNSPAGATVTLDITEIGTAASHTPRLWNFPGVA